MVVLIEIFKIQIFTFHYKFFIKKKKLILRYHTYFSFYNPKLQHKRGSLKNVKKRQPIEISHLKILL